MCSGGRLADGRVARRQAASGEELGDDLRHLVRKLSLSQCLCCFLVGELSKIALVGLGLALTFGNLDGWWLGW